MKCENRERGRKGIKCKVQGLLLTRKKETACREGTTDTGCFRQELKQQKEQNVDLVWIWSND